MFDAAVGLFIERGYANVSLADIAEAVGLKRNSLYRYFPSKEAILMRWFHAELNERLERSTELLGREGDPLASIAAWVDDQLDYAAQPGHALVATMTQIEPDLAAETRDELSCIHSRLLAPLRAIVARTGVDDEATLDATCELISGLILSAARHEARTGVRSATRTRLHAAIAALVGTR